MQPVRNLQRTGVVRILLRILPRVDDALQYAAAASLQLDVRRRPTRAVVHAVEGTGIRDVEEHLVEGGLAAPRARRVAVVIAGGELEDVGADVPAAQRARVPVPLHGRQLRVVVVVGVVGGAPEVLGDRIAEQQRVDGVALGVGFILVEGDQDEGVLGKVLVGEERFDEVAGPRAGDGDVGVMPVVGHVRGEEHVLGEAVVLEVSVELCEVLDDSKAVLVIRDGVVGHCSGVSVRQSVSGEQIGY